jgi:protein-S-isoprenylcysteine O-methyltransferase Ste14
MKPVSATFLALYAATFLSFAWGMARHFVPPDRPTLGTWVIRVGAPAFVALQLITFGVVGVAPIPRVVVGDAFLLMGLGLFWATVQASSGDCLDWAFTARLPSTFLTTGPYRYVRHPFYEAYIGGWIGGALGSRSWWARVPVFSMGAVYVIAARSEELRFMVSDFRYDYHAYKHRTGAFLPKIHRTQVPL